MPYDLHCHTVFSDGSTTVKDLLRAAERNGLDGIAITDHDTFAGYNKAIELKNSRVSVANGIRQNITNQKTHFIEQFFTTMQFCVAGNESEGIRRDCRSIHRT